MAHIDAEFPEYTGGDIVRTSNQAAFDAAMNYFFQYHKEKFQVVVNAFASQANSLRDEVNADTQTVATNTAIAINAAIIANGLADFQGIYSSVTPYTTGQSVLYNGLFYIASQNTTGNVPTNSTYWLPSPLHDKLDYNIINETDTVKLVSGTKRKEWTKGISAFTGAIKIELVGLYGFSMDGRMTIRIKSAMTNQITINLDGQWDAVTHTWIASNAISDTNINVRFCRDASKVYVVIGDISTVWSNTRVEIDNVLTNYNSALELSFSFSTINTLAGLTVDSLKNISVLTDDKIHSASSKTTPVDADEFPLIDSASIFSLKKLTFGSLKTILASLFVSKNGDETIADIKTFSSSPIVPTPTTDMQVSTKKYVDDIISNIQTLPIGAILNGYTIFDNCIVAFGGEFNRADYPKLWAYLQANPSLVKTQAQWQTEALANGGICGFFSDGNGTTTFRVPNLDKAFLRPDSRGVGSYQVDELKSHDHLIPYGTISTLTTGGNQGSTISSKSSPNLSVLSTGGIETRPKNIAVLPLVVAK